MKGINLGEFEELVLLIIASRYKEAYGVGIKEIIEKETGRIVNISAVHAVLLRLEKKGYAKSIMGEPSEERGGRRKRLFSVTSLGARALQESHALRSKLFNQIPQVTFSPI